MHIFYKINEYNNLLKIFKAFTLIYALDIKFYMKLFNCYLY